MSPGARSTGFLFAVALLLGAFVWLYELRGSPAREAQHARELRVFPGLAAKDVSELTVASPDGGSVTARRVADGWRITSPVDFPGVASAFEAMAHSISAMERGVAMRWLERAALGGSTRAAYALGNIHGEGMGTPVDQGRAWFWMQRAVTDPELVGADSYRDVVESRLTPQDRAAAELLESKQAPRKAPADE